MRIETKTRNLYKFDELTEEQKEKALEKFENIEYQFVTEDFAESIKAIAKNYGWKFDYSLGYDRGTFVKFRSDFEGLTKDFFENDKKYIKGIKDGSCPFTGNYVDCYLGDSALNFWESDFQDFLQDLGETFDLECTKACEHTFSDESKVEAIEANEYEFDENGNLA